MRNNPNDSNLYQLEEAATYYKLTHGQYISFLAQKAKIVWCKEGDENSSLFHKSIQAAGLKNSVYAMNDNSGIWQ